jgi:hypothetical protein
MEQIITFDFMVKLFRQYWRVLLILNDFGRGDCDSGDFVGHTA